MRPSAPLSAIAFLATLAAVTSLAPAIHAQEPLAPLPPSDTPPSPMPPAPPPTLAPAPPPRFSPPQGAPQLVANPRAVWMHVEAKRPVMLQLLTPYETRWQEVCLSPCDVAVPLDGAYRIAAPGIMGSRELEIEATPGDRVILEVNVRTVAQHRTAERLTVAGYIAGAIGLGLEIGALAVNSDTAQEALLWSGAGAAVVAISLAITSYVMGQPSGLSQSSASPVSAPPPGALRTDGVSIKLPVWRAADATLPPVTAAPLWTTAF